MQGPCQIPWPAETCVCVLLMPTMLLQAEVKAAALAAAKAAFQKQERENAQIAEKARKQRQGRAAPAQPAAAVVKPGAGSEVRHCGHHGSWSSQPSSCSLSLCLGQAHTMHLPGATLPHSLCTPRTAQPSLPSFPQAANIPGAHLFMDSVNWCVPS